MNIQIISLKSTYYFRGQEIQNFRAPEIMSKLTTKHSRKGNKSVATNGDSS